MKTHLEYKDGWFEKIEKEVFNAYKKEILKYEADNYQYIQFNCKQGGFALGLLTDPNGSYWEYIEDEITHFEDNIHETYLYEDNEGKFDNELDREEWPYDDFDCFDFQGFVISVAFGKVFLDLKNDTNLKNHLSAITKLVIEVHESVCIPFSKSFPDEKLRLKAVKKFVGHPENQALILDLWSDKLKGSAIDFLLQLNIPFEQKSNPIDQFEAKYSEAKTLYEKDLYKQSIELLEQILKTIFHEEKPEDMESMEKTCALIAKNYKAQIKHSDAIDWYKKGAAYLPWGYCSLNLMSTYKSAVKDFKELIIFGEKYIEYAETKIEDKVKDRYEHESLKFLLEEMEEEKKDYTFFYYNYLANAYAQLDNKEKAENLYQKILKLFIDDREKIKKVRKELKEIGNSNDTAKSVLEWFKRK